MPAILFLLPLIPLAFAGRRSPGWLFLTLYLPALIFIPDTFHTTTLGIPKMSANQAVIIAIVPFVLLRYARLWRIGLTDCMVFLLVALIAASEYLAAGYKEAQNLTFVMIAAGLAPYLVARLAIPAENLHVATARRIVILMFAVVLISVYEFKFGWNPFLVLVGKLFPGQGTGWVTTFRHGFARFAGPFSHAILAGIIVAIAYRLQRWLQKGGHWEMRFARFPNLPWQKPDIITATLLLGALMTIARGPWIGSLLGALLVMVGESRNRGRWTKIVIAGALILGPLGNAAMDAYLEVAPGMRMTDSQETALYRKELVEKYTDIALDHALLGWGRNTWPKVAGMGSIDNYFLLLSLMHGVLTMLVLVALFVWQTVRLIRRGMADPPGTNSLAFALAGILVAIFVSLVTVYLGEQAIPFFFLIIGWSEAVVRETSSPGHTQTSLPPRPAPPSFRVMR